ncbi:receptor-like protein 7 [Ziziphus jujuba]|uniref:Receptor-like protein 7 n=1 Tax=Ziziphus jujuba TaxID=326968 RepID=A0ABM3ZRZ3_ZIZJJ|nr:receptor-like protein 7 [Ziziphus jujuba]
MGLCDYPLATKCGIPRPLKLSPSASEDSGFHFEIDWIAFLPGDVMGLAMDVYWFGKEGSSLWQDCGKTELLRRLAENITSLRELDLGGLNFSSKVPESLGNLSSLTHLSLYGCNLHGDFPKTIFRLPNLQSVKLRDNDDLTGSLSEFHSGSNLLLLEVSSTKFGGKLPNSVGNLTSLNVLDLMNCMFSGPVPYSLGNLANISQLLLGSNEFIGEFPSSLGNLTQLSDLDLANNFFHGSLPMSFPYLLEDIYFKNNSFTGPVPFQTFSNLTLLSTIDLSSNSLNGVIPSSLLSSASLQSLCLDDNQLIDLESITSISSQLEYLSLNRNKLKGVFQVPSSNCKA